MNRLGWIGLGHMGIPMAGNLVKQGNTVTVYNRTVAKTEELVQAGASRSNSPKEVVAQSDITFIMLTDAAAVKAVLTQPDGVLEAVTAGKIIVDMSTISPKDSIKFSQLVAAKGGVYLDAPVSGSVGAAQSSQLVVLVGGAETAKATCQPYFDILGKATIYFGENGKGSAAKLAINLLLAIIGEGFAETVLFAEKLGVAKEQILELISQSAFSNAFFQLKKDMYAREEFPSQFMLELMAKDLGLIKEAVEENAMTLPLASAAERGYKEAKQNGKAKLDVAAIYLELKERNN